MAAPMAPPAPGRLSMMTCWPAIVVSCWPTMRLIVSVLPPAGQGTITRMGFVGKSAATTGGASKAIRHAYQRQRFMHPPRHHRDFRFRITFQANGGPESVKRQKGQQVAGLLV